MTNKEREAIEYLERQIRVCNENAEICDDNNFDEEATHLREESYMLDTVLSLIKAQQEEISKYKTLYERALSDVVKADKQIYLMADYINKIANDIMKKVKEDDVSHYSLNGAIMLYFKRKAESSK